MTSRIFFFGRTPELSLTELRVFAPSAVLVTEDIARVDGDILVDGNIATDEELMLLLGGTVKIATYLATAPGLGSTHLVSFIGKAEGRKTFGLSGYGVSLAVIKQLVEEMKDLFSSSGISARFVLPREGSVISSVAVEKDHVEELNCIRVGVTYVIAKTTEVQPFEHWSMRDYDRPYADSKAGMLPPKVARMVVNIALGADCRGKTLLDPFCGMGTIVGEAVLRGVNTVGGDIDTETITKAKKNISWLIAKYEAKANARLYVSDATHIADQLGSVPVDAIATEPFLGTPRMGEGKITDPSEIADIVKGLDKLYIGCLKHWVSVLKPGSIVVMAIPSFTVGKRVYSVKKVVDTCEILGYTKHLGPITYGRPHAIVQRNFFVFQKK